VSFPACPPWSDKRSLLPPGRPASASLIRLSKMEPPLGGFRLPLRYFQITSSSGRWERQARPVSWRELHDQTRGQDWGNPQKCARQGLLVLRQPKLSTRPSERKTVAGGKTFRTLQSMSAPSGDRRGPWPHPMDVGNHAVREDNLCVC
jgi:hypothetical protein